MHADTASSDADAVGCSAPHAHTAERRGAAQDMLEVGMASFVIDEHARHGSVHTYSAACAAGDCNRDLGVETGMSGSGGSGTQRRTAAAAQLGDRRDAERQRHELNAPSRDCAQRALQSRWCKARATCLSWFAMPATSVQCADGIRRDSQGLGRQSRDYQLVLTVTSQWHTLRVASCRVASAAAWGSPSS